MREKLLAENGPRGWQEPMEVLQGSLRALLSSGSVSITALLHILRSFSLCGFLPPPSLAFWPELRSHQHFYGACHCRNQGQERQRRSKRTEEGGVGEGRRNRWASDQATGPSREWREWDGSPWEHDGSPWSELRHPAEALRSPQPSPSSGARRRLPWPRQVEGTDPI